MKEQAQYKYQLVFPEESDQSGAVDVWFSNPLHVGDKIWTVGGSSLGTIYCVIDILHELIRSNGYLHTVTIVYLANDIPFQET
jgi:hypothetical protein